MHNMPVGSGADLFCISAPQCVAWPSEDKPFVVGYPSGKILLATTEAYDNEQPIVISIFQVCLQIGITIILTTAWKQKIF